MSAAAAAAPSPPDPVGLTRALIRCPSVTPEEGGALGLLAQVLEPFGFACRRVDRGGVANLSARRGGNGAGPVFGFCGHTDVVPIGERARWNVDPFGAEIRDGRVWGRGAVDMKSGVAAFVAAACREIAAGRLERGALALLITGDEEGEAKHGTRALLDDLAARGERLDHCLVGEPTSVERIGDVMKVGRRGSLNAVLRAAGRAGHTAYPERAVNPLPPLIRLLDRIASAKIDDGSELFQPTTLALTSVDVGNAATNVIPPEATARFNIRFGDAQSGASLTAWLESERARAEAETDGLTLALDVSVSGEAFAAPPGGLADLVAAAVLAETGATPKRTTGGGTSDARFVKDVCPVVEFGLTGASMHQVDEFAELDEIEALTAIYQRILQSYFA